MYQSPAEHRRLLIHVLHMAYSGEKAAAYAYNAHWKSLRRKAEQSAAIKVIEEQELDHRAIVGQMLSTLHARPQAWRELMMAIIGRCAGFACYIGGWFFPMYFAGRLESANVNEYAVAAYHAEQLGLLDFVSELNRLSLVEKEHELFFLRMVQGHWMLPLVRVFFKWGDGGMLLDDGNNRSAGEAAESCSGDALVVDALKSSE
jgi:hypothetical protein